MKGPYNTSIVIVLFLLTVLGWYFELDFFNMDNHFNKINCNDEEAVRIQQIKGVVIKKYKGSNDRAFVVYIQRNDTLTTDRGMADQYYDDVWVGDSITKEKGSLAFTISRMGFNKSVEVDYDCN
jgi:hypothetical protein